MRPLSIKILLLTLSCMLCAEAVLADITPPNYDFSLSSLEPFFPGATMEKIKSDKTIQSDIFEDNGNLKTLKIKLVKPDYKLEIYLQTKDDKVTDMFVRLPQHFYHDLILADLQKKYKKQDKFIRKDMSALYLWMNRDGNNVIYHGSCSITCFPMFIEIASVDKSVTPFYKKLNEALPKW